MDNNENFSEMSAEEQADVIAQQFFQDEEEDPAEEQAVEEEAAPTEEEPAESAEPESDPAKNYYSVEEFITANPLEVDPERLPDGARLVHKRYMEFYEREVAPLLRELNELRGKQRGEDKDPNIIFLEDVQRETMRRLGVSELDMYDASHSAMLNLVSREMADSRAEQQSLARVAAEIQNSPDFAKIDKWAQEQIQKMPKENADIITREIYSGNPARIKAVYDAFAQKYNELQQKPVKKEVPAEPPKVIPGSNGSEKETAKIGYEDFARASSKDQASMLISMGLVGDIEE